jgi:hypothetical protein
MIEGDGTAQAAADRSAPRATADEVTLVKSFTYHVFVNSFAVIFVRPVPHARPGSRRAAPTHMKLKMGLVRYQPRADV